MTTKIPTRESPDDWTGWTAQQHMDRAMALWAFATANFVPGQVLSRVNAALTQADIHMGRAKLLLLGELAADVARHRDLHGAPATAADPAGSATAADGDGIPAEQELAKVNAVLHARGFDYPQGARGVDSALRFVMASSDGVDARVEAALALHVTVGGDDPLCLGCDERHPCSTRRALTEDAT